MTGQPEEKENYTKIPNDILELIYTQKLNGSQYAIMLLLWRKIFGFHHCEEKISAGYISKGTGLNIKTVKKELSSLAAMNIIQIISNGERSINTIKLNKKVDSWLGVKQPLGVNQPPTGEQMTPKGSGQSTPNAGGQMTPQEIKKETIKETSKEREEEIKFRVPHQSIVDLYHGLCPSFSKVRIISDERKKHISARYKQYGCGMDVFKELFNKAEASSFLKNTTGTNKNNWKADFDWLMNETNMSKVLENKFINKPSSQTQPTIKDETGRGARVV